jgi:hypothetical protein
MYRNTNNAEDYKLLRYNIDPVLKLCLDNGIKLSNGNVAPWPAAPVFTPSNHGLASQSATMLMFKTRGSA